MAEKTEISWTDATFNPWMGCTKVGPGCDNCYAEELMDTRYGKVHWGVGAERVRTGVKNWNLPQRWNIQHWHECTACGLRGLGKAEGYTRLCTGCGQDTLKPARRRVFCSSLADVFDNEVDRKWRADLFQLIRDTPNLDWLLLTKRIGNAHRMLQQAFQDTYKGEVPMWWHTHPLPNIWLGATIVNQEEADRDIPKLLAVPARVRFLSMEPLLGAVDLSGELPIEAVYTRGPTSTVNPWRRRTKFGEPDAGLHWVIVGGESGKNARPMPTAAVRSLRDQCAAAGVAFHFKQWGEWSGPGISFPDGHPELAKEDEAARFKVGKKAAGRELDGRTHNEFPCPT